VVHGTHYRCASFRDCYDANTPVSDADDFRDRPFAEEELGCMLTELAHKPDVMIQCTLGTPRS
jgi:hypothetical protein